MTRLLVVVPTTGGPAILRRLSPREGLPVSAAFADGDYRPVPWSADYARLAAAGGPIARELGSDLKPHELRLDRSFDAGRSWEAPVSCAHLLLGQGFELTDDPALAEVVLWTTGAVDLDLAIIPGDYAVAEKIELSGALFDAANSARIVVAPPPGTPAEAVVALKNRANVDVVRGTTVEGVVVAFRQGADLHLSPAGRDRREAPGEGASTSPENEAPPHPPGFAGRPLPAGERWEAAPSANPSEPPPPPPPTPPRKGEGGKRLLPILGALMLAVLAAAGAGGWYFWSVVSAPNDPFVAIGPKPPRPPDLPKAEPSVAIDELRAPTGKSCAQALFGAAQPERRSVAPSENAFAATKWDASLCGVAIRPSGPQAKTVTVSGGLAAAALAPRVENGAQVFWLRAGQPQKLVYEVQGLSQDGARLDRPMRHELAP